MSIEKDTLLQRRVGIQIIFDMYYPRVRVVNRFTSNLARDLLPRTLMYRFDGPGASAPQPTRITVGGGGRTGYTKDTRHKLNHVKPARFGLNMIGGFRR